MIEYDDGKFRIHVAIVSRKVDVILTCSPNPISRKTRRWSNPNDGKRPVSLHVNVTEKWEIQNQTESMRKDDGTRWESERSKAFNIFSNQTKRKVNVIDE